MKWLTAILFALVPVAANAATINTASCAESVVQAALDSASAGDEIHLPNCNVTWSVNVHVDKAVTLSGNGPGNTIITGAPSGAPYGAFTFLTFNSPASGTATLKNIEFWGPTSGGKGNADSNLIHFYSTGARTVVQNVKCTAPINTGCYGFYGYTRGVVSGGSCTMTSGESPGICITLKPYSWGNVGWYGDKSWNLPSSIGTDDAVVFENFTCTNTSSNWFFCFDANAGARFTVRFSTFNNMFLGTHGLETSGRTRGVRQFEYYGNTFNITGGLFFASPMSTRGGTGIVWGNTITTVPGSGVNQAFDGQTYRSKPGEDRGVYSWAHCLQKTITSITRNGTTATATTSGVHGIDNRAYVTIQGGAFAGTYEAVSNSGPQGSTFTFDTDTGKPTSAGATTMVSPFDQHANATTGYACLDGAGRGMGDYISGEVHEFGGTGIVPLAWTNQILDPIYIYRNLKDGSLSNGISAGGDNAEGRDFYNEGSGIGVGTLAARPSTCTTNTGYWATDQGSWNSTGADGVLYYCSSTNVWAVKYTPLAYPHPLLSGITPPSAPTVTIATPSTNGHSETTGTTVTLTGTASDDVSVASVTCNHATLGACTVTGTTNWSVTATPVTDGIDNVFTITATDNIGGTGTAQQHVFAKANPGSATDIFSGDWAYGPGPQWRVIGTNAPVRASGKLSNTGFTFDGLLWLPNPSVTNNQHIEIVIGVCAAGTGVVGVLGRVSGTTNADFNAYNLSTDCKPGGGAGSTNFGIFRNGAYSSLVDIAATFAPADTLALELQGNFGRAYQNGVQIGAEFPTGGELTTGGYGVRLTGTATLDNFGADDLGGDATAPVVTITAPNGGNAVSTTTTPFTTIAGTASDANGISACTATNSAGGSITVTGTTSWTLASVDLFSGVNHIVVDCTDPTGNHGTDSIDVTFAPPPSLNILRIRR